MLQVLSGHLEDDIAYLKKMLPPLYSQFMDTKEYSIMTRGDVVELEGYIRGRWINLSSFLNFDDMRSYLGVYQRSYGDTCWCTHYGLLPIGQMGSNAGYFVGCLPQNADKIYKADPQGMGFDECPERITAQMFEEFDEEYKIADDIYDLLSKLKFRKFHIVFPNPETWVDFDTFFGNYPTGANAE